MSRLCRAGLLVLLCVVLLGVRAGGAHLHLCFAGPDPVATVHQGDGARHGPDEHGAGDPSRVVHQHFGEHDDHDISLIGEVLLSPAQRFGDLPVLLLAVLGLVLLVQTRRVYLPGTPLPYVAAFSFLRPPLRGPPLIAS